MLSLASFLTPDHIVQSGGLTLIALMIFSECGLLIGIFFPGDTLLIAAGVFSAAGKLSLPWLLVTVILSTIIGYEVGYRIGERLGPKMFQRQEGVLFRREYIEKTQHFFNRYGKVTLLFGRFIANVRTFISLMAGAGKMDKKIYTVYNIIGGTLWAGGVTLLGYGVGSTIPNIDHYIVPLLIGVLVMMYAIIMYGILRDTHRRAHFWAGLKSDMRYLFSRKA